ncbi:MAG: diguanylate cyclase [Firmicutes bacterium]|nr:diguanylate cyclase [Bacillota bacterium]
MDGLTNINNRRFFDEFLMREWKRAARGGTLKVLFT